MTHHFNLKSTLVTTAVAVALGLSTAALADDSTNSKQQPAAAAGTTGNVLNNSHTTGNTKRMDGKQKATAIGAGSGAVAGAVVGGPVGAVIGGVAGAVIGHEGTDANGRVDTSNTSSKSAHASDANVMKAQTALNDKGFNVTVDGRYGPNTASAVRSFQSQNGLTATGRLDNATLDALGVRGS